MSIKHKVSTLILLLPLYAQAALEKQREQERVAPQNPPFLNISGTWARAQLQSMSLAEKIGQLFMIDVTAANVEKHVEEIQRFHVGGVWLHGPFTTDAQRQFVNTLQNTSNRPLLVGQDQEWGTTMRLTDGLRFPKALTLGALSAEDDHLLYALAQELARQARRTGVHVTAMPVADLNTNPQNPVIGFRSYGDDQLRVIRKLLLLIAGLQEQQVLACIKHFPGHGDTATDSHRELSKLMHDKQRLESVEIPPFAAGIKHGVSMVMTAHLHVPALDNRQHISATLSYAILQELLRRRLRFNGLIISDALTMHAITDHFKNDEAALLAYQAGNDILIYPRDLEACIARITEFIGDDAKKLADLDNRVLRILLAKEWLNLHNNRFISEQDAVASPTAQGLKQELYKAAITTINVGPDAQLINPKKPILVLHTEKVCTPFEAALKAQYGEKVHSKEVDLDNIGYLAAELQDYGTIVLAVYTSLRGVFDKRVLELVSEAQKMHAQGISVVVALFGSPYTLQHFNAQLPVVVAYEDDPDAQNAAACVCMNPEQAKGKLPVVVPKKEL